jgi:pimeloyl-ACP methyl ester carboxylesterase
VSEPHHIYLVPGFFGFANLGDLRYFGHVQEFLAHACPAAGLPVEIHAVRTEPTSSLPRRACRVLETIAATAPGEGPVHLIGHSSGGLDARLLVAPEVALPTEIDVERFARRVRTVVTVSAPHYGTPLASFLTGLLGQQLLQLLSLTAIVSLRLGRLPLSVLLRLTVFAASTGTSASTARSSTSSSASCWPTSRRTAARRSAPSSPTSRRTGRSCRSSPPTPWTCSTPPRASGPACATDRW